MISGLKRYFQRSVIVLLQLKCSIFFVVCSPPRSLQNGLILTRLTDHGRRQYLFIVPAWSEFTSASVTAQKQHKRTLSRQECTSHYQHKQTFRLYDWSQRSHITCSTPLTHIWSLYYCVINRIITNLRHRARRPFAAEKIQSKIFFESAQTRREPFENVQITVAR